MTICGYQEQQTEQQNDRLTEEEREQLIEAALRVVDAMQRQEEEEEEDRIVCPRCKRLVDVQHVISFFLSHVVDLVVVAIKVAKPAVMNVEVNGYESSVRDRIMPAVAKFANDLGAQMFLDSRSDSPVYVVRWIPTADARRKAHSVLGDLCPLPA